VIAATMSLIGTGTTGNSAPPSPTSWAIAMLLPRRVERSGPATQGSIHPATTNP